MAGGYQPQRDGAAGIADTIRSIHQQARQTRAATGVRSSQLTGLRLVAVPFTEWRAQDTNGAYVPFRASSFPTSSSRGAKQDITDLPFDPLEVIAAAPAQQWEYRPDRASDTDRHISPMADDLPPELVRGEGDDRTVDSRDLLGVLWAAVGAQQEAIERLTQRVAELEKGTAP